MTIIKITDCHIIEAQALSICKEHICREVSWTLHLLSCHFYRIIVIYCEQYLWVSGSQPRLWDLSGGLKIIFGGHQIMCKAYFNVGYLYFF